VQKMFEFNFEVNEPDSSDIAESPFNKPKLDQDRVLQRKLQ